MKLSVFSIALIVIVINAFGQGTNYSSNAPETDFINRLEIKSGESFSKMHSVFKPFNRKYIVDFIDKNDSSLNNISNVDKHLMKAVLLENIEFSEIKADSTKPLLKYFYKYPQDFYRSHADDYFISVNPVIHLGVGYEQNADNYLYVNTRGIEARGLINDKIGFYTYMADNQARFPAYVNEKIDAQERSVPGEGWNQEFGEGGYDFFKARGYISLKATKNIDMQFGQDKHFIGHGIRSLLLSDYSNDYLFLKINTQVGIFNYQNIFAELVDYPMRSFGGRLFDKKYSTTHVLSTNISPKFQLALFENVIYGRADETGNRGLEMHYLNPIIFYRAIEHHMGDADKVAIGLNWRWLIRNKASFYGQIYIDDFHLGDINKDLDSLMVRYGLRGERKYEEYGSFRNKFAFQTGLKIVDLFGLNNFDVQAEVNLVRPYVYSHYDTYNSGLRPSASYTHYSQALAHPLGANFREYIGIIRYQPHRKLSFSATIMYAEQGIDTAGVNLGYDILNDYSDRPGDYDIVFLQGNRVNTFLTDLLISWEFRPNFWLDANFTIRQETHPQSNIDNNTYNGGMALRMNINPRRHIF
ncbi:MAG: hypothetical protein ACOCWC_00845 [Bacteroidota bacterium]